MAREGKKFEKPKNPIKTIKRIFSYLSGFELYLSLVLLFVLISSGAQIAGTYFLKPLINNYILPYVKHENPDLSGFINALMIMGCIYAAGAIATFVYNRIMVKVATTALYKIRTDLFSHLQTLPLKYFDSRTHGEIMSRFTSDTDALRELLGQSSIQFINSVVMAVGVFISMLLLSPVLTLIVVAMLFVMLNAVKGLGKRSRFYFGRQQKSVGNLNGYVEEMIEGQKVVKVFNYEEVSKDNFEKLNDELFASACGANTFANLMMPVLVNLSYVLYAVTAMLGAIYSIRFGFDLGSLASFLQYTRSFSQPINQISQQFNSILQAIAGAERIFEVLDQEPETDEGFVTLVNVKVSEDGKIEEVDEQTGTWAWKNPQEGKELYTLLKGDVTFTDVVFGYEENKTVLKEISLYAKPGQKIAFVGSTGAGKTTITNLLNRFYDVPDGRIRYDGININKIKKADLRRSLGMVLQDTHLFSGTIFDNIRYGRLDATDEEVVAAAKLANAHSFIKYMPEGYNTYITDDGGSLSQGQRQLLSIARAAVANPPVLVLDEATSSIDTRTEFLIEEGMNQLMKGRTVFVIAHRLSTVRNANAIMVMENGEIIERGDHSELLKEKGRYYKLYTGMFELS
ncbi:ABC transporter ATP-binding protein [Anaeropeptidivorans aminofermentans]|uniref:ABC transporter ATP-binding protein n=1 Tax=Anaeropeptidivorans aminofermentans TaxID=2934315 RepID=UPI002023CD91|nr:ABC transporter ATP-binding protein [Anaeropeptidivorans aminofermentans]